jgi:hypothetical protein
MTDVTRQSSGRQGDSRLRDGRCADHRGRRAARLPISRWRHHDHHRLAAEAISGGTGTATIDIASGETLRVNSINSVPTAGTLTLGTAVNTGTLTPATAGGNLLLINSSTAQ